MKENSALWLLITKPSQHLFLVVVRTFCGFFSWGLCGQGLGRRGVLCWRRRNALSKVVQKGSTLFTTHDQPFFEFFLFHTWSWSCLKTANNNKYLLKTINNLAQDIKLLVPKTLQVLSAEPTLYTDRRNIVASQASLIFHYIHVGRGMPPLASRRIWGQMVVK